MPRVTVNDLEMNVHVEGAGQPLLFVHGFPLDQTMWRGQLSEFAASHRVIAPDLRGFGSSQATAGTATMAQFADDLNGLLDALNVFEPVTFCGLSMGGYIAWPFVEKYPNRVRSLILCDTRAAADSPEASRGRLKTADEVLAQGPEAVAKGMLTKLFAASTYERAPELVSNIRQTILKTDPIGIAAALRGMADRPDRSELLGRIRVRALVIVGREDKITPVDEMRAMAAAIRGAEFVEIPDAGHLSPLENPAAVNAAMRSFLEESAHASGLV